MSPALSWLPVWIDRGTRLALWRGVLVVALGLGGGFTFGDIHAAEPRVLRGPYLQMPAPTSMTVRWRTDVAGISRVQYGTEFGNLYAWVEGSVATTNHTVTLTNLLPGTFYYYSIGLTNLTLTNGASFRFRTPPVTGSREPFRVW